MLLDINIEKMKQAALAATQGKWDSYETKVYLSGIAGGFDIGCYPNAEANADFIAEANPSAVLELIAKLEAAEQRMQYNAEIYRADVSGFTSRLEAAEQDAARYETLQNMSGLCFSHAVKYQLIGGLNDYVDAIKPQVDKAIAALKESK